MEPRPTLLVPLRLPHAYSSLARRRTLACAVVFLLTLGLRFGLRNWLPVPNPIIHDEFSYLLAADTYAHGRLANPPHPFWQHFETFHVLQEPTYASKYQALQGMALALGQKLFGEPPAGAWLGVALTSALMCAAVCWMLQGWIAEEWALAGALLFLFRVGVLSYWMNSYEGGAIPALGGALVLGAVGRIALRAELRHAWTWGLGLAILMHSRPYDAAVLGVVSALLFLWMWRKQHAPWIALVRVAVPLSAVLAVSLAALAYVDFRVTGNALTLPYQLHDSRYVAASPFVLAPLPPQPAYRHAAMRDFYTGVPVDVWRASRSEPVTQLLARFVIVIEFLFGAWPLAVALLVWPFALKTPQERAGAALAAAGLVSVAPLVGVYPHYAAAFASAFLLRFLQSLSRLAAWRGWLGPALAGGVMILFVLSGRDSFSATLADRAAHFGADRAAVERRLEAMPGDQLVLVRYAPGHNSQNEWVFNRADIDGSKVVWAREMTPEQDQPFLAYFHNRQAWLLEADLTPPRLAPYALANEGKDSDKEARR